MSKTIDRELILLRDAAFDRGTNLSSEQLELFRIYLDELMDWNKHINLTGLRHRERVVVELFLDSLVPVPYLPERGRMLDVGSGAGIPGLPLKICRSGLETDLLEPYSKKASFLKHVIRLMKLDGIKVIKDRIGKADVGLDPCGYDVVTARALADLPQIIKWCVPHLKVHGKLVGFLGHDGEEALERDRQMISEYRLETKQIISYLLPGRISGRTAVILEKAAISSCRKSVDP